MFCHHLSFSHTSHLYIIIFHQHTRKKHTGEPGASQYNAGIYDLHDNDDFFTLLYSK